MRQLNGKVANGINKIEKVGKESFKMNINRVYRWIGIILLSILLLVIETRNVFTILLIMLVICYMVFLEIVSILDKMKVKLKIIYKDGDYKLAVPFTFSVRIMRYKCKFGRSDFIMETFYYTAEIDTNGVDILGNKYYKCVRKKLLLDVQNNGEAIRFGVKEYYRLESLMKELRNEYKR